MPIVLPVQLAKQVFISTQGTLVRNARLQSQTAINVPAELFAHNVPAFTMQTPLDPANFAQMRLEVAQPAHQPQLAQVASRVTM